MLFDLERDPLEQVNRAGDPAYADVHAGLRERLERWMAETDDPLRHGAIVTPVDSYEPTVEALDDLNQP